MILTDEEMKNIRLSIEAATGMDEELLNRCSLLMHMGAFDEAVRNAFVLLEERLRSTVDKDGLSGVQLANHAFAFDSILSKHLGRTSSEREGLRELYSGAFKLFRNPAAHSVVSYSSSEGKSIIGLVNLLLAILARANDLPPINLLPMNIESVLSEAERSLGIGAAGRLRTFISKCVSIGLKPQSSSKQWIPFRRHALIQYSHWPNPKPFPLTIFYLARIKEIVLWFPVNQYYKNVRGLNTGPIQHSLRGLRFTPTGKHQDYQMAINSGCNQAFFDELIGLVIVINKEVENTLENI